MGRHTPIFSLQILENKTQPQKLHSHHNCLTHVSFPPTTNHNNRLFSTEVSLYTFSTHRNYKLTAFYPLGRRGRRRKYTIEPEQGHAQTRETEANSYVFASQILFSLALFPPLSSFETERRNRGLCFRVA